MDLMSTSVTINSSEQLVTLRKSPAFLLQQIVTTDFHLAMVMLLFQVILLINLRTISFKLIHQNDHEYVAFAVFYQYLILRYIVGTGCFVISVETAARRKALVVGKPERVMFECMNSW